MSLAKWLRQSALVCAIKGPYVIDITEHPYAKATTPDEIIAAALLDSIAKNFGDWKMERKPINKWQASLRNSFSEDIVKWYAEEQKAIEKWDNTHVLSIGRSASINCMLRNENKKWKLLFQIGQDSYGVEDWYNNFYINNVPLLDEVGRKIIDRYFKLKQDLATAERVAREAKERMEAEEKKWNLAENMLGLKRNEHGALVPKEATNG